MTKRKQKNKKVQIGVLIGVIVSVILLCVYFGGWVKSVGKFLPNTYINDVAVGGMKLSEALAVLGNNDTNNVITITEKGGASVEIPYSEFDYACDIVPSVRDIYLDIDYSAWFKAYFKETNHTLNVEPTYNVDKLERLVRKIKFGTEYTADAQIEKGADGYVVKPEVYGDILDSEQVAKYVVKMFKDNNVSDIDLISSGLYTEPVVKAVDLAQRVKDLNEKYNYTITYDFTYTTEVLNGSDVFEWTDEQGNVDSARIEAYVNKLADKYDTFKTTRHFQSTNRGMVSIDQGRYSMGQYGWWIDKEKTIKKLTQYIENGESVTVEPEYVVLSDTGYTYKGFASGRSADSDIGDTYIEVDLTNQHLWYYRDGECLFETDQIVSGKASDPSRKTPYGVFSVYTKSTDYKMKTPEYTADCKYFMRISFEGVGFHDYSRPAYGGDIYLTNGSHGCINMKLDEVAELYELVERGTPVVMYY